jgi:phytoene dehydrogenase-like protein
LPLFIGLIKYIRTSLGSFATRFKHPLLRRFFPLLHSSIPEVPVFLQLSKHGYTLKGDLGWPRGGSLAISKNIAARYESLGGSIHYGKRVAKILTEGGRACGVELEDGTRHMADYVVSNADGRKTIMGLLEGAYVDDRVSEYCRPNPDDDRPWAVTVYLGVKRDLSAFPSALLLFLDKDVSICGHTCDHLDMQIYGFDADMAPEGKGVIKVELFAKASHFSVLYDDDAAYRAEKERVADQVVSLLDARFPGLRADVEVVDVVTLRTWERYMGGTEGCDNFPKKGAGINVFKSLLGLDDSYRLPGLKGFYLVGGWVTSAGALLFNAISGKTIIRRICKDEGRKFIASRGIAQT